MGSLLDPQEWDIYRIGPSMGMNWLSFSKLQLASFQAKGNVLVQALSNRDVSVVESKSGQRERDEEDLFFR